MDLLSRGRLTKAWLALLFVLNCATQHGSLYDLLQNNTVVIDGETLLPLLRDMYVVLAREAMDSTNPYCVETQVCLTNSWLLFSTSGLLK